MEHKVCTKCRSFRFLDSFYRRKNGTYYSVCKVCCAEHQRERWKKNKDRVKSIQKRYLEKNPDARVNTLLKNKFGITLERYNEVLSSQGGACAICLRKPGKRMLCVDHSHKTGKVRGILCHQCNHAIGLLRDDPSVVQKAAEYLTKYVDC